jgi:hypothetical protein
MRRSDTAEYQAHSQEPLSEAEASLDGPTRQCGRCRQLFAADPTSEPGGQEEWWLCPPCDATLLGKS